VKESGEMRGYIVLRKVHLLNFNSAVIFDLLAVDQIALFTLVKKGIYHSQQEGVDLVGFMVSQDHLYNRILRQIGFLPSFKTFRFMVYSHWKEEVLSDPKGCYIALGDTNVI
jgi:hypothetical protein